MPSAFELIYAPRFPAPARTSDLARSPARPVLLAARAEQRRLIVTVRFFGVAMLYQRQIEAALLRTLEAGVAVTGGARSRARMKPETLVVEPPRLESQDPPRDCVILRFRSPLAMLRRNTLRAVPQDVIGSLPSRIAALAAWQGLALAVELPPLAAELGSWDCSWEDCRVVGWERRSAAQPGRVIPMIGLLGRIRIEGRIDAWQPLLRLAPITHIGSHTTFGMGAVSVGGL